MGVAAEFWRSVDERDWERCGDLVADDVEATWPQSRERCRGRAALVRFLAEFPGSWHLTVSDERGDAEGAATRIAFTSGGETVTGITFFVLDAAGRIASLTEYWPEPYDPPDRHGTLERY